MKNNKYYIYGLMKFFSCEADKQKFLAGSVLLRPPHYFRTSLEAGRGDQFESCVGFYDKELGHKLPRLTENTGTLSLKDIKSILIYPVDEPYDAWMQSWCAVGTHNGFEDSLSLMLKKFGNHFVFLPANRIETYKKRLAKKTGLPVTGGLVQYTDDRKKGSLMTKSIHFEYQKEYRFLVGECSKGETKEYEIFQVGSLNKIVTKYKTFKFTKESGEIIYCSNGFDSELRI